MKQCLQITFMLDPVGSFLRTVVQEYAKSLRLEGVAQIVEPGKVKIVVCGADDALDELIGLLYQGKGRAKPQDIQIEPLIKDRDYRGVFRVIEQ